MKLIAAKLPIRLPRVPNFLQFDHGAVPLGSVTDADLRRLGAAWTQALLERAREQRKGERARQDESIGGEK